MDPIKRLEDATEHLWETRFWAEQNLHNDWLRNLCRMKVREASADILRLAKPRPEPRAGVRDAP